MNYSLQKVILLASILVFFSCKKENDEVADTATVAQNEVEPKVIFKIQFDSTLSRLDNLGNPTSLPSNHGAQSPIFHKVSAHYLELAKSANTLLGQGEVLYKGEETAIRGANSVDFDQVTMVENGGVFKQIPIGNLAKGTYNWVRLSLTYQNYNIKVRASNNVDYTCNLASFVGYNTYITSHMVGGEEVFVNDDKLQGYWALKVLGISMPVIQGQAPAGATTVPNPNWQTSPVPQGSCVVTGEFNKPLVITGNETEDIVVTLALSTNNSFEWKDYNGDNVYEPSANDTVVDMGLRGLFPIVH